MHWGALGPSPSQAKLHHMWCFKFMPQRPLFNFTCEFSGRSNCWFSFLLTRVTDTINRITFLVQENMTKASTQQKVSWLKINDIGTLLFNLRSNFCLTLTRSQCYDLWEVVGRHTPQTPSLGWVTAWRGQRPSDSNQAIGLLGDSRSGWLHRACTAGVYVQWAFYHSNCQCPFPSLHSRCFQGDQGLPPGHPSLQWRCSGLAIPRAPDLERCTTHFFFNF